MRTVLGSVALSVGGFLALFTILTVNKSNASGNVPLTSGGGAAFLTIAGLFLLLWRNHSPSRRWIVVPSLVGALAGLVFAMGSKNYEFGKHCGIEASGNQTYKLTVRAFGKVRHEESGPAVQRQEEGSTITGPSQELETTMAWWELELDIGLIGAGAFLGGILGLAASCLRRSPYKEKPLVE
jgi:hypothetical protein